MPQTAFFASDASTTPCLLFPEVFHEPAVAQLDPHQASFDGSAVPLKAADRGFGLPDDLTACLEARGQAGEVDT